jgi:hypothetical protein
MVDWVLLGSGRPNKGEENGQSSPAACLEMHTASFDNYGESHEAGHLMWRVMPLVLTTDWKKCSTS